MAFKVHRATGSKTDHPVIDRIRLGSEAESAAMRHLESRGLALISQNFAGGGGEIDLVMRDDQYLVFVEVRYRRNQHYGGAAASVDRRKQKRIIHAAEYFIQKHPRLEFDETRFDVVAVSGSTAKFRMEWIPDAFQVMD